ncbi:hypothetical protein COLO4_06122 [Corchorus olitorius]|uniref:Uncharacterized protein n=1 Tax=Corchorus olitorius TaxID=93759 RepID=A0A1R3KP04_9ROSI|nr:hypothetical protein COLO4_06122 [Corchorus olitorius]
MSSLPQDMIIDILCRCVVDDLLRFRCLSKGCCSLIDSPDFINLHLSHSLKIKPARQMVISREQTSLRCISVTSPKFKCEPFHEHSELCENPKNRTDYRIIPCHNPFDNGNSPLRGKETEFLGSEILGSCNGLVALLCRDTKMFNICLLNPSTRVCRYLQIPYDKVYGFGYDSVCEVYGFGYNPVLDDYKLVQLSKANDQYHKTIPKTKVYSFNSNCWKSIDGEIPIPYPLDWPFKRPFEEHDVIVAKENNAAVAFDLTADVYSQLSLPKEMSSPSNHCKDVYEFRGCLCVNLVKNNQTSTIFDIWVMEEYGAKLKPLKGLADTVSHRIQGVAVSDTVQHGYGELPARGLEHLYKHWQLRPNPSA